MVNPTFIWSELCGPWKFSPKHLRDSTTNKHQPISTSPNAASIVLRNKAFEIIKDNFNYSFHWYQEHRVRPQKNSRMVSFDLDTWAPRLKVNPVNFFWSKMAWICVLHIVLHVLCGTHTSGVHFRPPKVSFSAIFAFSGVFFYKAFFQNWFSQNPLIGRFCPSGIWICTLSSIQSKKKHPWNIF